MEAVSSLQGGSLAPSGATAKARFIEVTKRFGTDANSVQALESISLDIAEGAFVCLVGPSGCGKSTLLNILAGFETSTTGETLMDGVPVRGPDARRGVVFQQGALFTWMSVRDNVAFGPIATGKSAAEAGRIADRFLEMVGLSGFAKRYPYELSGGMQQRVGIARALANDPEILLMDEPFAALDAQTRELLQEEIKTIWQSTRKTILWITHSIEEALFLATDIVVMSARPGRIKARLRPDFALSKDPAIVASAEFVRMKAEIFTLLREESLAAQRQESER
ncbi:MAG: ABC transporter ATP-binding protein [Gammaproteobacteria bacterium]|nr:ABC transporter ATP-binding protein [Gammaproteobacteria bacterium]MBU1443167.1 ABC transporter ATP-binding protein [Gammaproteobacteria bacterium]MBU2285201.1 ABC transporter ATP-binding protein [Gammaproteobacteria bacterium]